MARTSRQQLRASYERREKTIQRERREKTIQHVCRTPHRAGAGPDRARVRNLIKTPRRQDHEGVFRKSRQSAQVVYQPVADAAVDGAANYRGAAEDDREGAGRAVAAGVPVASAGDERARAAAGADSWLRGRRGEGGEVQGDGRAGNGNRRHGEGRSG